MGAPRLMPPPRFVLDTSVVFPALRFHRGQLLWLREAWQAECLIPLTSSATVAELLRVLAYRRFGLNETYQRELIADYLPWCETVDVPSDTPVPDCRDPSYRPFLELAMAGQADALVTGDADLLALAPVFTIPILTAREAWERLANV